MVKRFLSFFCALATVFLSVSSSFALDVSTPVQGGTISPVEQDVEWFCEEHQQPLIPEKDVLPGTHQVCLYCHPEYCYSISLMGTEPDSQFVAPVGAAVSFNASLYGSPTSWTNMSTLADESSGMLIYYYNTDSTSTGYFYFRFIFSEVVQPVGDYLYFYYSYSKLDNHDIRFSNHATPFPGMTAFENVTNTDSSVQSLDYVFSGSLSQALLSGNTYYLSLYGPVNYTRSFYFSGFYINVDGYLGSGGGGSVQPGEPEGPGFDDADGWLGSLISSIIAGINEIIDGIGSIGGQITSAVSNIGTQISNAVNSIGTAITGAVDSASSVISSAVDSASSAITGIIGQQWNDQSGHNDDVDTAISDIEHQDDLMGAVEDQYLSDFDEQQQDMSSTLSTFQWPSGITSAMAWITIQMNSIWSGLGGNVQMLFTFSMILGLSLIFLGRWRA